MDQGWVPNLDPWIKDGPHPDPWIKVGPPNPDPWIMVGRPIAYYLFLLPIAYCLLPTYCYVEPLFVNSQEIPVRRWSTLQ